MPSASEILSGANKKAKSATESLLLPIYDHISKGSREPGQPLSEKQKAWDEYVKAHQEGGDVDTARKKYESIVDRKDP